MHARTPKIIAPDLLLMAYRSGIFPMSDSRDDEDIYWVEPRERAIIPLDRFHCSRSLAKIIRQERFVVTCNAAFDSVIAACAAPRPGHPESWISNHIAASYRALHAAGHAHSIECWQEASGDDGSPVGRQLVGGLYGVGFEHAFCGESMFSRQRDASKVALAWLVALLRRGGYQLLDCQFMTEHLNTLGAVPLSRHAYLERLADAVNAGPAPPLPALYASLVGAAGSGAGTGAGSDAESGAGDGEAAGALARGAEVAGSSAGAGASCPGKLILQSLTHTS
jgi:leucyl/phenylalanyl-tRNA--protein transferase